MDIKDFILIGGGSLIAAVIAHGLWIAWRARHDPLRIDLVSEAADGDDPDDLRRFRAELPNGGARLVSAGRVPRQEALELEHLGPDELLPGSRILPLHGGAGQDDSAVASGLDHSDPPATAARERTAPSGSAIRVEPIADDERAPLLLSRSERLDELAAEAAAEADAETAPPRPARTEPRLDLGPEPTRHADAPDVAGESEVEATATERSDLVRGKVADVIMPERSVKADEPKEPRRWTTRRTGEGRRGAETRRRGAEGRRSALEARKGTESRKVEAPVQELIMINLLAPKGSPFVGGGLVESLRARGLRYGDMNIFHRQEPMTRTAQYSVANVVEPGTFDMADLDNFRSPGVCFFLQLPGPEHPLDVFEDMLKVARDVAVRVGGELKDEQRSVMTGQTVEHYRQRISEFCRRRMSMRA